VSAKVAQRLPQVSGVSLAEQARETIRRAILDGTFAPEERISIEQIASELGISRTPVREALKALEGDGLVQLLPHRGAVVTRFARDELHQRYSIRAMLEGYAAELATRADGARIGRALIDNCDELEALAAEPDADVLALSEANQRFHAIIREGSGSATVIRLLDQLRNPTAFSVDYWSNPERRRTSIASHRKIANAIRRGDAARARQLLERHLLDSRDLLVAQHDALASHGDGTGAQR
jgi:DNA-binding GntR family transcriptional regulator